MFKYPNVTIHNVSRPGQQAKPDDVIEVETPRGFVKQVAPKTRRATAAPKQFVILSDGMK